MTELHRTHRRTVRPEQLLSCNRRRPGRENDDNVSSFGGANTERVDGGHPDEEMTLESKGAVATAKENRIVRCALLPIATLGLLGGLGACAGAGDSNPSAETAIGASGSAAAAGSSSGSLAAAGSDGNQGGRNGSSSTTGSGGSAGAGG